MGEENNVIKERKDIDMSNIYVRTFIWMFMGLLATGIISYVTYYTGFISNLVYTGMFPILAIVELIVVLLFSFLFKKLSPTLVSILFFVYAAINGVGLSTIFVAFDINSISIVFIASALLFGVFAIYGTKTKKDLSKISTLLFGTLFICIIVSIITLFVYNSVIDTIVSWIVLFVFFGVTAYDMQKIKHYANIDDPKISDKIHIYGAMELYLDFINIFIRVLSIFGDRKN